MQQSIEQMNMDWFDPFDVSYIHDPLPTVSRIHRTSPIFFFKPLAVWVVAKYDDIKFVLKDANTFSSKALGFIPPPADLADNVREFTDNEMLPSMDPPEHTALRQPTSRVFTHKLIQEKEPLIRERANKLIDTFIADGSCDLMKQYCYPLTLMTIVTVFGLPAEDSQLFRQWSDDFLSMLSVRRPETEAGKAAHPMPAEEVHARWSRLVNANAYFKDYVTRLRRSPGDDVISALLGLKDDAGRPVVSDGSAVLNLPTFVTGGHDTTANIIDQAIILLAQNPEEQRKVRSDHSLLPQAIEVTLRMRGSLVGLIRHAKSDARVGSVDIRAGSYLYLMLNAAGLDEEQFDNPGKFDLTRHNSSQHLSFGFGRHSCIGNQLAKMQARVAVGELLRRIPSLRLADDKRVEYIPSFNARVTASLPIEW